jgi:hypothetical protein
MRRHASVDNVVATLAKENIRQSDGEKGEFDFFTESVFGLLRIKTVEFDDKMQLQVSYVSCMEYPNISTVNLKDNDVVHHKNILTFKHKKVGHLYQIPGGPNIVSKNNIVYSNHWGGAHMPLQVLRSIGLFGSSPVLENVTGNELYAFTWKNMDITVYVVSAISSYRITIHPKKHFDPPSTESTQGRLTKIGGVCIILLGVIGSIYVFARPAPKPKSPMTKPCKKTRSGLPMKKRNLPKKR